MILHVWCWEPQTDGGSLCWFGTFVYKEQKKKKSMFLFIFNSLNPTDRASWHRHFTNNRNVFHNGIRVCTLVFLCVCLRSLGGGLSIMRGLSKRGSNWEEANRLLKERGRERWNAGDGETEGGSQNRGERKGDSPPVAAFSTSHLSQHLTLTLLPLCSHPSPSPSLSLSLSPWCKITRTHISLMWA